MTTGPDPELARLFNASPPEHRDTLARILGTGDYLARHMPMHDGPRAIVTAWLVFNTTDAYRTGDPAASAIGEIAAHLVEELGARMALTAGLATMGVDPDPTG